MIDPDVAALANLQALCSARRLTLNRRTRIKQAMQFAGVGSIRVGRRVFECPNARAPLEISVLPAEPGVLPAAQL